jgi:hypothetical protein
MKNFQKDWVGFFANFFDTSAYSSIKFKTLFDAGFKVEYRKKNFAVSCNKFAVVIDFTNKRRYFFPKRHDAINYLEMLA